MRRYSPVANTKNIIFLKRYSPQANTYLFHFFETVFATGEYLQKSIPFGGMLFKIFYTKIFYYASSASFSSCLSLFSASSPLPLCASSVSSTAICVSSIIISASSFCASVVSLFFSGAFFS